MTLKTSKSSTCLPSYKKPPVNEVVFGIRFNTPEEFRLPHIGLFWGKIKSDYPNIQHKPPIASNTGDLKIDFSTGMPIPRMWFINESDDTLVQFQVDRFYFNWRHRDKEYPRFESIRKEFARLLGMLMDFFIESGLGEFDPIDFELSYINHIPKIEEWNSLDDLSNLFTDFLWHNDRHTFLPKPVRFSWSVDFSLPDNKGKLSVNLKHAMNIKEKSPVMALDIKATGNNDSYNKESILEWFDLAHEWIVKGLQM
jgi:uncharacterized protein (TIGR04255 family)